jgi:hypothetical protein
MGVFASIPALLAWLAEWVAVPATMIWLWLRWVVRGPVLVGGALTLEERKAAREGTLAGSALALLTFLLFYSAAGNTLKPSFPGTPANSIQALHFGPLQIIALLCGLAVGMLPRWFVHVVAGSKCDWMRGYALSVWMASGFAVLSILAYYFAGKDVHIFLLAVFLGLAAGYRMSPIFIRFLRFLGRYP